MINKKEFDSKLSDILNKNCSDKKFIKSVVGLMERNHKVETARTATLLNMRENEFDDVNIEELYWLADSIKTVTKNDILLNHFTENENIFKKTYVREKEKAIKYPIVIDNVLQVNYDQWVTVSNSDLIFDLYINQIINYNKNTQRPTTEKEIKGESYNKITVVPKSIKQIANLMKENLFTPNAITLNLNQDNPNTDFEYKNGKIIIYSGFLDIIDGYHRCQAMIKNKLDDSDFVYPTIINIVAFDEMKARNFIAQEDKRNKIKSSFSKSMDSTNLINVVIQRLNDDPMCHLHGMIGIGKKIKNETMFEVMNGYFKIKERSESIAVYRYLKDVFNALIEDELFDYSFFGLSVIIAASAKYRNDIDFINKIEKAIKNKDKLDLTRCRKAVMSARLRESIEQLLSELEE